MPIPFTSNPLKVAPPAASGVSVSPSGTSWVNGAYVEVEASTSADWLLAGISVAPSSASHSLGVNFEVDVAVGASGSESDISTFHGVIFGTAVPRGVFLCPIAVDAIPQGSRVSVRIRETSTATAAYRISVHYYAKPIAGNIPYTTQPLTSTADGSGSGTLLTSGSSAWADGSYAEIVASTSSDVAIVGIVHLDTSNGAEYEIDLATGGSGSESVIGTVRDVNGGITDGEPFVSWFPSPIAVASGTRIAARLRSKPAFSTSGGVVLLYFEQPLGSGVPDAFLTTSVLKVMPAAASAISLSPGAGGAYGTWTEVTSATSADLTLAGVTATTVNDYDVELGVGTAGNEVSIGVFKFAGGSSGAQANTALMPVAVGDRIPSGSRIAARLRSDSNQSGAIALSYYESFNGDNITTTAVPAVLPDDGSRAALTPNTSAAWADTGWVQLSPGLPRKSAVYGVVFEQATACELEVEVGTGGAGSETVIATVHAYKDNAVGYGVAMLPALIPVTPGLRIAMRGRRNSTSSSPFNVGLLYYDELDVSTIVGGIALGYKGTVQSSRSLIVSLDGNTNTLNEVGKMKVFGKFEVTDTVTLSGLVVTESNLTLSDVTTDDVSTTKHGFAPKAPNDATKFLDGTGAWSTPVVAGSIALDDLTDVALGSPLTDGEFLTYDAGSSSWVNAAPPSGGGGSGALVLVEQHTASSSASLNCTSGITSAYDEYMIELIDILPATDGADLWLRVSTDGGSSYDSGANYATAYTRWSKTGASQAGDASDTRIDLAGGLGIGNASTEQGLSATFRFYNPLGASGWKKVSGQAVWWYQGTPELLGATVVGAYKSATAVNALQLLMSSGNIASGVMRLYGVAKT